MAGPKQPIDLLKVKGRAHLTKSEIKEREQQEIHAPADKIEPPGYLTKKQKSEFNKISSQLIELGIMSNLDCDCLARYIIAEENYRKAVRMMKKLPCEPERANMKIPLFHMTAVKRIAQIGLPSMLQQSLVSLSMMLMQGLVNSYGKVLVAGYTAATKIDTLAMLPNMNFSNAMSSYTAQNIGAGKYDRVKEGLKACLFMVVVFSLVITVIIFQFINLWNGLPSDVVYNEEFKSLTQAMSQITAANAYARYGPSMAASVIMMIPPIVIFVSLQSKVIETMTSAGIKG